MADLVVVDEVGALVCFVQVANLSEVKDMVFTPARRRATEVKTSIDRAEALIENGLGKLQQAIDLTN